MSLTKRYEKMGEDPSNFAIKLETLAVKAFGNMGQVARLRLIRGPVYSRSHKL